MKRDYKGYLNKPDQVINYIAHWYLGRAKRRGWDTTLKMLNDEPNKDEIKAKMKEIWGNK